MAALSTVLSLDPDFRLPARRRARYPESWSELRSRILTRMSDSSVGSDMYTITRSDTGQCCKLLAFDALDALLKFHGRSFKRSFHCDQVDGRLRAIHNDSAIEYVVTSVEPYFAKESDAP